MIKTFGGRLSQKSVQGKCFCGCFGKPVLRLDSDDVPKVGREDHTPRRQGKGHHVLFDVDSEARECEDTADW